jgi:23S rRNA (uracil1939-C5)-methyltransferase
MRKVVEKLDDFGRGIVYVNNKITFIPKCVPGDEIEFVITDEHAKYFTGKLNKVILPSKDRIEAKCPFYDKCGGCSLQNLSYDKTISFKKEKIENLFKRNKLEASKIEIIENPSPFNYRNKLSLKIIDGIIGFYEENTHDIVSINKCLLAKKEINKAVGLLPLLKLSNANITIRCNYLDEILLVIDTKEKVSKISEVFAKELKLKGIIVNDKVIYGQGFFEEKINDIKYEVSYNSFFQVNPHIASLLFKEVLENIDKNDIVFDLYSGVGALSLVEAKVASKVVGIEIVKNAVINATKNKEINKIDNVEFLLKDLSEGLDIPINPTCVVIDPPRSGIDKKTMNWIINSKPNKIIYVSCDPNTLVRDIKLLDDYNIKTIKLFDMFSYTYHCESVTVLERKESRV